jgi:signal transduction histidine kinase
LKERTLIELLQQLVQSVKRTGQVQASLDIIGEEQAQRSEKEIVLFRICQEIISNSLKYAECSHVQVQLQYLPGRIELRVSDDGLGFDPKQITKGNGLHNIYARADVIQAQVNLHSQPNEGTHFTIVTN